MMVSMMRLSIWGFGKDGNLGCGFGDGINGVVEPNTSEIIKEGKVEEGEEGELMEVKPIEQLNSAPPEFRRVGKVMGVSTVSLMQILTKLDDHLIKASESAQEVSKMLEATRLHYHSNFADNRGIYIYLFLFHGDARVVIPFLCLGSFLIVM